MNKKFFSNIKIVHIYIVFVILMLIAAGIVLYGTFRTEQSIVEMQKMTEQYTKGQNAIDDLMRASDYLTKQARVFVVTGAVSSGLNYNVEVTVTKRRDKALDTIGSFKVKKKVYDALESALKRSNHLMETEYYAMLLAAKGDGLKPKEYESFVGNAKLTKEDEGLSNGEKIKKATDTLFGTEYDEKKDEIRGDVAESLDELMDELEARQVEGYELATELAHNERNMIIAVLLGVLVMIILTTLLIVKPIMESSQKIINNEPLPMYGSREFYTLAKAYNRMLHVSQLHQEQLSYDATHDALTGLYNRKMFDEQRKILLNEQIAMLIIDVDHFKEVNDTYGHEAGDEVLKKVAAALKSSFRLEDCICRIGGDEFAVLMRQIEPTLKSIVREKIDRVQEKMQLRDDLPRATLSIGVAFTDDEGPEENLFKKADKALYSIKENGRDGFAFYNELKTGSQE